jgi:hypothetical protein
MTLIAVNLRVAQEVPNLTSGVRGGGEDQDAANDEPTKGFNSTRAMLRDGFQAFPSWQTQLCAMN